MRRAPIIGAAIAALLSATAVLALGAFAASRVAPAGHVDSRLAGSHRLPRAGSARTAGAIATPVGAARDSGCRRIWRFGIRRRVGAGHPTARAGRPCRDGRGGAGGHRDGGGRPDPEPPGAGPDIAGGGVAAGGGVEPVGDPILAAAPPPAAEAEAPAAAPAEGTKEVPVPAPTEQIPASTPAREAPAAVQAAAHGIEPEQAAANRIYWGAWIDGDVYDPIGRGLGDAPWSHPTWDLFESHAEKSVSIAHFGQPPPWEQEFDAGPLALSAARGAIPLVDMANDLAWFDRHVTLRQIASGTEDEALREWSKAVARYRKPFFLRWAWEMNGGWFPWGAEAAAAPSVYVDAWRHVHDLADEEGAANITWVWCPNVSFSGSTSLERLYPGAAYVDWTCMDGYNFGGGGWASFSQLFRRTYAELLALAPDKPIMIGETGSAEKGGSKAAWIDAALGALPVSFPAIKALVWFNWNIVEGGGEREWPIESSPASREAFANAIASPYFAAGEFGSPPELRAIQPLG